MKRKLFLIIVLVLLISSASILAFAISNFDFKNILDPAISESKQTSRTFVDSNGKNISLSFSESKKIIDGTTVDIYVDSDGNQYMYNKTGKLMSTTIVQSSDILTKEEAMDKLLSNKTDKKELSQAEDDKIIKVAYEYAHNIFGDSINKMIDHSISKSSSGNQYYVKFEKKYGSDGFISGPFCAVVLTLDGQVTNCSMPQGEVPNDFDETLVEELKLEDVTKYTSEKISGEFKTAASIEYDGVTLVKVDGKYCLKTNVSFTIPTSLTDQENSIVKSNNYEISIAGLDVTNLENTTYRIYAHYYYPLGN